MPGNCPARSAPPISWMSLPGLRRSPAQVPTVLGIHQYPFDRAIGGEM